MTQVIFKPGEELTPNVIYILKIAHLPGAKTNLSKQMVAYLSDLKSAKQTIFKSPFTQTSLLNKKRQLNFLVAVRPVGYILMYQP